MIAIYFKENIKYIRQCYGLTQAEMAKKYGINMKSYQAYEEGRGTPVLETIANISLETNISIDSLVKDNLATTKSNIQIIQILAKKGV